MGHEWAYERVRRRPPRCLARFRVRTDSEAARAVRARLGGDGTLFELLPPSEGQSPVLLGHYLDKTWPSGWDEWFKGRILVSPLFIRWEPSGDVVGLFDGARHGYNPEHGLGRVHGKGVTPLVEYEWPGPLCQEPAFVVCLSHTFDSCVELLGEEAVRPEDFFDWLTLAAWSRPYGSVHCVADFECA